MTFLDVDVVRVLEEVLPARFGGGPTDYQLAEDEAADGRPRLRLLAHPALGPLDEPGVVDAFLTSIGRGAGAEQVMARMWRDHRVPPGRAPAPLPDGHRQDPPPARLPDGGSGRGSPVTGITPQGRAD